jgi:hypothetical protein
MLVTRIADLDSVFSYLFHQLLVIADSFQLGNGTNFKDSDSG